MNKTQRQAIYLIAIFLVTSVGIALLEWSVYECVSVLFMMALIQKLTDLEDTLECRLSKK